MGATTLIQIFTRAPQLGAVKTRLAADIGERAAMEWHLWLTRRTLATAASLGDARVEIWVDGDAGDPWLLELARRFKTGLRRQPGGDLGRRLGHAARAGLRRHPQVLMIGSDCAGLGPEHLSQASQWLAGPVPAVMAPAEDGGYVLLGLRRFHHRIFDRVDWGSRRVAAQTRRRLRRLGMAWRETETLWDVDRADDLRRPQLAGIEPGAGQFTDGETRRRWRSIRRTKTRRNRLAWRRTGNTTRRNPAQRNS